MNFGPESSFMIRMDGSKGTRNNKRRKRINRGGKRKRPQETQTSKTGKNIVMIQAMNVDGLDIENMEGIYQWLRKNPKVDIMLLSETKRREDQREQEINLPGYAWSTKERTTGQKGGGGILSIWKEDLNVHPWKSPVSGKEVEKEREWILLKQGGKLAICNVYLAAESRGSGDYRSWNDKIIEIIQEEIRLLRLQGFEIVVMGDMNGHCGQTGGAMRLNRKEINSNGGKILHMKNESELWIANEEQKHGEIFTRYFHNREGKCISKTVLDISMVGEEIHRDRIQFCQRRDADEYIESDHKMIQLEVDLVYVNTFIRKVEKKPKRYRVPKNIEDWDKYTEETEKEMEKTGREKVQNSGTYTLTKYLNRIMVNAAERSMPYKPGKPRRRNHLPREILEKLKIKKEWKKKIRLEETEIEEEELKEFQSFGQGIRQDIWNEKKKQDNEWRIRRRKGEMSSKTFWETIRPQKKGKMSMSAMRNREGDIEFETDSTRFLQGKTRRGRHTTEAESSRR